MNCVASSFAASVSIEFIDCYSRPMIVHFQANCEQLAPMILIWLVEEIRMSSSSFKNDLVISFKIDKKPVRLNMAFPSTFKIPNEPMVSIFGIERFFVSEFFGYFKEFIQVFSSLFLLLQFFFELVAIGNFEHLFESELINEVLEVFTSD